MNPSLPDRLRSALRRPAAGILPAALFYLASAIAMTWPLAARLDRSVPGDLLDPLFTCWALGWNYHHLGLDGIAAGPTSFWDANIFYPEGMTLARSEHFFPQALLGAPVFLLTGSLVATYNCLVIATFALSGLFLYLWARDEIADDASALAAGFLYAFAVFRWTQLEHLGGLSSQWMPLCLLLARAVVRNAHRGLTWRVPALGLCAALQVTSSGYYLLYFPPFLLAFAALEAARARAARPFRHLALAGLLALVAAAPLVAPYVALRGQGAFRDLQSVVEHSADVLSWVTAPEITRLWGPLLNAFPRGEARTFPGLLPPLLALVGCLGAAVLVRAPGTSAPQRRDSLLRGAGVLLVVTGVLGFAIAALGGWAAPFGAPLRIRGTGRPAIFLAIGALLLLISPASRGYVLRLAARREIVAVALALVAAVLSLGPVVTLGGYPLAVPSPYRWLYETVPGFSSGRAPARFAMIAACFGSLAAGWGLWHLRRLARARWLPWAAIALFAAETSAVPLPVDKQWRTESPYYPPEWRDGGRSPATEILAGLPHDAVIAVLPFGDLFHDVRAMFDSTGHWRKLLNGYSSWAPERYSDLRRTLASPLSDVDGVLDALRRAGVSHVVIHERAWRGNRGRRLTERLVAAGGRQIACVEGSCVLKI